MALACSLCAHVLRCESGLTPVEGFLFTHGDIQGATESPHTADLELDAVIREVLCEVCGLRLGRRFLATSVKMKALTGCVILDFSAVKPLSQEEVFEIQWREMQNLEPRLKDLEDTLVTIQRAQAELRKTKRRR